jgi:hypothetical protein
MLIQKGLHVFSHGEGVHGLYVPPHDMQTTCCRAATDADMDVPSASAPHSASRAPQPSIYSKGRGDSILEEAMNSEFSLKVMISAGSIALFQVRHMV